MFTRLTDDLLDLSSTEKGRAYAVLAANDDDLCSCSCTGCVILCCCFLCW
ncbi:MAG TPA: hypothetical protein VK874_10545 [Gaiellaceae bacterium]|jgi:hypothetical protein|nr:hypothetical protein [Gaiellaceae bacterium]